MLSKFFKIVFSIVIYLLLVFTVIVGWGSFLLYKDGKKLPPQAISYIEKSIEGLNKDIEIFVSGAEITFISFSEGFDIVLKDGYIQLSKDIVASIPEMHARLKLKDLLLLHISLKEVFLERPQFIIISHQSDNYFKDSFTGSFFSVYKNVVYNLFDAINKENNLIPVEKVLINNANFSFNQDGKFKSLILKKASLEFYNLQNSTYLKTDVETDIKYKNVKLTANARLLENSRMILSFDYKNVPFDVFTGFMGGGFNWLNEISPILDGKGTILMEKKSVASTISLKTGFKFNSQNFKNTSLTFDGEFNFTPDEKKNIIPKIDADITLKNLEMPKLKELWPEQYAADVRKDVIANYTKGTFKDITLNANYEFKDLGFKEISKEKYNVRGHIKNADVKFSPRFPVLENVKAFFFFDGANLAVDVEKGKFGNFKIGKSFAEITNVNDPVAILEIRGTGEGKVQELKPLLHAITRNRDDDFYYNTREITADSNIKFYYKDNINNGFDANVLKLAIEGNLTNVNIKNAFDGIDFKADNLLITAQNNGIKIKGEGIANNNSKTKINVFVGFHKQNHYTIKIDSELDNTDINNTIKNYSKYVNGISKLKLTYKSLENSRVFTGNIDFLNASVTLPEISIVKDKGKFLQASFYGNLIPTKAIEIANFQITDKNSSSEGSAIISLNDEVAEEIYFSKLNSGRNNAKLYYSVGKYNNYNKYNIKINGTSFDAEYILSNLNIGSEDSSYLNLEVDTKNLYLQNDVNLKNSKAKIKCNYKECYKSFFLADIDKGGSLSIKFAPDENDKKIFKLKTNNFGRLIEGFGFKNAITKGEALILASKDEKINDENLIGNGTIEVKNFEITQAPILAKIFSLASITGIGEIFSGSGIFMEKLKGNFSLYKHYIAIEKITASGNSLGLTLQGTADFQNSAVDFSGVVTPSYSINSMLGKIPALGILFKAKEGEGLIATKYSVKGVYPDKVDVSVNPFSAFTPGVLREIWGRADIKKNK
jgi:hypothetical protein